MVLVRGAATISVVIVVVGRDVGWEETTEGAFLVTGVPVGRLAVEDEAVEGAATSPGETLPPAKTFVFVGEYNFVREE
jgi:hypothetical protein